MMTCYAGYSIPDYKSNDPINFGKYCDHVLDHRGAYNRVPRNTSDNNQFDNHNTNFYSTYENGYNITPVYN